jgi:hypothetical protein
VRKSVNTLRQSYPPAPTGSRLVLIGCNIPANKLMRPLSYRVRLRKIASHVITREETRSDEIYHATRLFSLPSDAIAESDRIIDETLPLNDMNSYHH